MGERYKVGDAIYEKQGDQYVLVDTPQAASYVTKAADPDRAVESALKSANLGKAMREAAVAPYEARKAAAEATKAEAEARKALAPPKPTGADNKAVMSAGNLLALRNQLNTVRQRYNRDLKGSGIGSITEFLPTPKNQAFNSAASGLADTALASFRVPGVGAQSDRELAAFVEANQPRASDFDETIEQKLANLENRVNSVAQARGEPPAKLVEDDFTRTIAGMVGKRSTADILRYAAEQNRPFPPELIPQLEEAQERAKKGNVVTRAGFTQPAPSEDKGALDAGGAAFANGLLLNQLGEIAGFGNTIGQAFHEGLDGRAFKDVLSENIAKEEAALAAGGRQHPIASTIGGVGGTVTSAYGALRGAAKLGGSYFPRFMGGGRLASGARAAAGESVYGAAYGAGDASGGGRAENAFTGAIVAPVASAVGGAAVRGSARLVAPVVQPAVRRLADQGIIMTPGQRRGGIWKRIEDKAMSVPIIGDAITGARQRGVEQFNQVAVNRALAPINDTVPPNLQGHEAVAYAQQRLGQAYDAIVPQMQAQTDQQFTQAVGSLRQRVQSGLLDEAAASQFESTFRDVLARKVDAQTGNINGQDLHSALSEIRRRGANYSGSSNGNERELGAALNELGEHLQDSALRHSPPDVAAAFRATNEGYANLVRVEGAAKGTADGVFTPGQLGTSVRQADRSVRKRQSASGQALMQDLASDAREVLPSGIPNSATADRLFQGGGALALGTGGLTDLGATAATVGATSIPYLPGIDRAIQNLAINRPDVFLRIGQEMRRRAQLTGRAAIPLALQGPAVDQAGR